MLNIAKLRFIPYLYIILYVLTYSTVLTRFGGVVLPKVGVAPKIFARATRAL